MPTDDTNRHRDRRSPTAVTPRRGVRPGAIVLACRDGDEIRVDPDPSTEIRAGMSLLVHGPHEGRDVET